MITVKDFCEGQQLSKQGVYAKIKRNAEKLKGHVTKSDGVYVLDDFAADFLKRRPADYPLLEKCCKLQNECKSIKAEYEAERGDYAARSEKVKELEKALAEHINKSIDREKYIKRLEKENADHSETVRDLAKENVNYSETQQELLNQIRVLSDKNIALENQISELTQKNEKLTNDVSERDEKIAELENRISEYEAAAPKKKNKFFS